MKIGFTGTRKGLTLEQRNELARVLKYKDVTRFHHGDCLGADRDAHFLVRRLRRDGVVRASITVHPPENMVARAYCWGWDICRAPKPYLERNRDIVDETDELIACPASKQEELRSGTWATVRYARKVGKPVLIIFPDGQHGG